MAKKGFKLVSLHEESPEGIGFRNSKNLGRKIAKAMGLKSQATKSRIRRRNQQGGQGYAKGPRINSSPVPRKQRHRKFFGMGNPHTPY